MSDPIAVSTTASLIFFSFPKRFKTSEARPVCVCVSAQRIHMNVDVSSPLLCPQYHNRDWDTVGTYQTVCS